MSALVTSEYIRLFRPALDIEISLASDLFIMNHYSIIAIIRINIILSSILKRSP